MTVVIGLLNKKGAVIAADSAVTRSRREREHEKTTKNGNKMLRLSDKVPGVVTSVMVTGSACFLDHPWDVIIRHYRKLRGKTVFKTLEENVDDFISFLCRDENIWKDGNDHKYIKETIQEILFDIPSRVYEDAKKRNNKGELLHPEEYENQIKNYLISEKYQWDKKRKGFLFENYDINEFIKYSEKDLEEILNSRIYSVYNPWDNYCDPEILKKYKESFLKLVLYRLTTEKDLNSTLLVFTGFGKEENYPSLIAVKICGGIARRPVYFHDARNSVKISDSCPSAICRFAQTDIIDAILKGLSQEWRKYFESKLKYLKWWEYVESLSQNSETRKKLLAYGESCFAKLEEEILRDLNNLKEKNEKKWIKDLENFNLQEMSEFGLNLINLTAFHRILTFQQEGVGGEIDRAILTKEKGFEWVHRKSWNHHQDVDGKYGSLGV